MLVILKIPIAYLCAVVWWAVRAEPRPLEGAARLAPLDPPPGCSWHGRALGRPAHPRRGGGRPVGARRAAFVRASARVVAR